MSRRAVLVYTVLLALALAAAWLTRTRDKSGVEEKTTLLALKAEELKRVVYTNETQKVDIHTSKTRD